MRIFEYSISLDEVHRKFTFIHINCCMQINKVPRRNYNSRKLVKFAFSFQNIQLFFHIRNFLLNLRDEEETRLPISLKTDVFVEVNDCINLG